jgi:hypothetical protein
MAVVMDGMLQKLRVGNSLWLSLVRALHVIKVDHATHVKHNNALHPLAPLFPVQMHGQTA